ncbi:MAG: NfeD family protein, partial [Pseudomonadota bacterium]
IIFIVPFASVVLFYMLPIGEALLWFTIINGLCFFVYYKIYGAMKRTPQTGKEGMIGKEGTVIETTSSEGRASIGNELWFAISDERLEPGQKCTVVGFAGLKVVVKSK